jgi:DNA-binding CsgD family transcriptional regulator
VSHPLDRPHEIRSEALTAVFPTLGAEAAQYYMCVRGGDHLVRIHGCHGVRENPEATARWRGADGVAMVLTDADPDHLAPINQFAEPPPDMFTLPFFRWGIVEVGYQGVLYANVALGEEHRGLVAFLRAAPGPWGVERDVLAAVSLSVARTFRAAWDAECALAPPAGTIDLDASGQMAGDPALLQWADQHAFASWARPRIDAPSPPTPFGQQATHSGPAAFLRVMRHAAGGATCALEPVAPMILPPVLTALSPALRRVASLAAAGATVPEIARALDRSPETVKESLAKVYERLGVSSRAELAAVARRMLL